MTDIIRQHKDEVHKIAVEIDRFIAENPKAKSRFAKHIDCFYKMVEDFGQALKSYKKPCETLLEKLRKCPKFCNNSEYKILYEALRDCGLPENWVVIPHQDTSFVFGGADLQDFTGYCFCQPPDVVNPTIWFQLEKQLITRQRGPDKDEELMLDYVLLAVVHDQMMQQTNTKLFPTIGSKWFDRSRFSHKVCEIFCDEKHVIFTVGAEPKTQEAIQELQKTFREKKLQLDLAFKHIKADPASTKQNAPLSKSRKLWNLIKIIPRWIYFLVLFLAALLTIPYCLGWVEPIKAFIVKVLWPK